MQITQQLIGDDLAENEILSNDGFIYSVSGKQEQNPQQQSRTLEAEDISKEDTHIKGLMCNVAKSRTWKRDNLVKMIASLMIDRLKAKGYYSFTRAELNTYTADLTGSHKQKQRIISLILEHLIKQKVIREDTSVKWYCAYRNKPLSSCDYGSYAVLMAKNGYKKYLYKYTKELSQIRERKPPQKKKVMALRMGESIPADFDAYDMTEIKSNKPQGKQAVYSNGNKSLYREKRAFKGEVKVYTFLI